MTVTNSAPATKPPAAPADFDRQLREFGVAVAEWVQTHWLQIIVAAAIASLIVVALLFARHMGEKLCRRRDTAAGWGMVFGRAVVKTSTVFIVMLAARLVVGYAGAPPAIETTATFLFTLAAVLQAAIWAREIILGAIEHRTRSEHYAGEALGNAMGLIRLLVSFAVFVIALVVVLDNLGVNVTGLVAGLGVGGIAIGLAAQGIFADLFAALSIIFDRPFSRGDVIAYDDTQGTVEAIGLKSTRIRSVTGEERIISNKNLLDKEIRNNTRRERRRVKFALGVIYQTAPEVALAIPCVLQEIVEAHALDFVRSGFIGFGASSLDFELEFDSPGEDFQAAYDARHVVGLAILQRFNADGIAFAYPTQTSFTADPAGRMVLPYAEPNDPADPASATKMPR